MFIQMIYFCLLRLYQSTVDSILWLGIADNWRHLCDIRVQHV